MPLAPGSRLGPYEIVVPIGAGGMGEVYRAKDTKLDREVAIKVLPAAMAQDHERLARFEREAKVLASLNHPHIAQIYGLEEGGASRALVMELVQGDILRVPQPLETALNYAKQIADALEAAHEKGITHRDLKPANIMVTSQGVVKVLDFGLASVPSREGTSDPTNSPTLTMAATQAGMIMGTAAYMSPEQAAGKVVDKRSDIWSFGVVLWEMIAGRKLFDGETISHTLAHVLTAPIEFSRVKAPPPIAELLQRCLDRDPRKRLRDIGEARLTIEKYLAGPNTRTEVSLPTEARVMSRWSGVPWAVAALAVVAAVALWALWRSAAPFPRPLLRLSVDLGPNALAGANLTAAISPDGTRLVYPARSPDGKQMLATRPLDQTLPSLLEGTENATEPFFSPDGQWIGFFADNKLQKISIQGGAPVVLSDSSNARGASWGDDGSIVAELVNTAGLVRVPASGGLAQPLTPLRPNEATQRWPQVLPGSQAVLFTANNNISGFDDASIDVLSLKTNQRKTVWRGGYFGRYLPANGSRGYLVYIHQGTLFAAPFDPAKLELQGTPVPLLGDVASDPTTAGGQLDIAQASGALVYRTGKAKARTWPVLWLDRAGKTQTLIEKPGTYYTPTISPDGRRLAIAIESAKDLDTWIYDVQRESMSRLTYSSQGGLYPVWTPDGKHIIIESRSLGVNNIDWIRSDGAGNIQRLLESKYEVNPYSLSPDGGRLAYAGVSPDTGSDLWTLPLDLSDPEHPKPGKAELFLQTPANEYDPAFSPDGRWIAYSSTESGVRELYVRPFPGPGGKWQISTGGGKFPRWSGTGHTLYYETPRNDGIMEVDYTSTADSFSASKPHMAASARTIDASGDVNWDVAPDGKRFVIFPLPEQAEEKGSVHVTFLLNFLDELRRKVR